MTHSSTLINHHNWHDLSVQYKDTKPFNHVVIDNFWESSIAEQLATDFPKYDNHTIWTAHYKNPVEDKKSCNHWDKFPATTYQAFNYLNSPSFLNLLEIVVDDVGIFPDVGLHGGGWHAHQQGGKLNVHLDYSIHPKLKSERKYNLIIYMTPDWNPAWGGGLELWSHDPVSNKPRQCEKTIENKFNRAVIFDTTQNSWHGLPKDLQCPLGVIRQSMAVYYLIQPTLTAPVRPRAKFAPYQDQASNPEILDFIEKRGSITT